MPYKDKNSFNAYLTKLYYHEVGNSKRRGHPAPLHSKVQLGEWLLAQPIFVHLWTAYAASGYISALAPSVDRIDESKGYEFPNMQLMTWRNNALKHTERVCTPVNQFKDSVLVGSYESIAKAARQVSGSPINICKCCQGKAKTAYGYVWEYS